jgi:hypothetical protein
MVYRILLVGCGNVGSRHLQALLKIPFPVNIDIIEPNISSKKLGLSRLEEISYNKKTKIISWHNCYTSKILHSDLVIVATLSKNRANLLIKLIKNGHKRILAEKILCQSKNEYEKIIKICKTKQAKIWVNTNPRCFNSYIKLKKLLIKNKPINLTLYSNPKLGLGTNIIHYLDLFSWMNDDYDVTLDGALLNKLLPNKRGKDFVEFSGTVTGHLKNNAIFVMSFLEQYSNNALVKLSNNLDEFCIDETNQTMLHIKNYNSKLNKFSFEHTSTLTTSFTIDILKNDSCTLPTLLESFIPHLEIFQIFNKHINKITKKRVKLCPIT